MLVARHISVRLGAREVLHGIDFTARAGAFTIVVGPNGSGKTTLLRAITGEAAHDGSVSLNGRAVADYAPWELAQERAVLPQSVRLAFPFTVREVVRMGLQGRRALLPGGDPVAGALARVDLAGYAGRFCQELSGGEQQRVQLARVLLQVREPVEAGRPRWLFLDEPVSALDIGHQMLVLGLLRDYARQGGGVVAVMHDLNLTAMFADRVAVVQAGRIAAEGPPAGVLTAPLLSRVYGWPLRVETPAGGLRILPEAAAG